MMLYRIGAQRQLVTVRALSGDELASLGADWDSWLAARGYGREFTLRRGIVREDSARERAARAREVAALKRQGKGQSAATAILAKLAMGKGV